MLEESAKHFLIVSFGWLREVFLQAEGEKIFVPKLKVGDSRRRYYYRFFEEVFPNKLVNSFSNSLETSEAPLVA